MFPEEEYATLEDREDENENSSGPLKIFKIKYKVNLLPIIGAYYYKEDNPYTKEKIREVRNEDINFLGVCCESDELELFSAESI